LRKCITTENVLISFAGIRSLGGRAHLLSSIVELFSRHVTSGLFC